MPDHGERALRVRDEGEVHAEGVVVGPPHRRIPATKAQETLLTLRPVSLKKLESRERRERPSEYLYNIIFEGNIRNVSPAMFSIIK